MIRDLVDGSETRDQIVKREGLTACSLRAKKERSKKKKGEGGKVIESEQSMAECA